MEHSQTDEVLVAKYWLNLSFPSPRILSELLVISFGFLHLMLIVVANDLLVIFMHFIATLSIIWDLQVECLLDRIMSSLFD